MYKFAKWLWNMAYGRGQDTALFEITSLAQYHHQQAEITAMRERYEPPQKDDDIYGIRDFINPPLTADQHMAIARALDHLANRLNPPIIAVREVLSNEVSHERSKT